MGCRHEIEARKSGVDRTLVRVRLLASLRQEPYLNAKGEQLQLCCMSD